MTPRIATSRHLVALPSKASCLGGSTDSDGAAEDGNERKWSVSGWLFARHNGVRDMHSVRMFGIRANWNKLILTWQGCPPDQQGVALMWSKPLHSGVVKHHDKLLKWVLADCIISVSGVVRSRTTPSSTNKKTRIHMFSHIVVAF